MRDLSFENFVAPALPTDPAPEFDIDVGVDSRQYQDMHEVLLSVRVTAKCKDEISFIVELQYAGLFQIDGLEDKHVRSFLLTEAPRLLFPFVDRICSDLVRDGGLPPLSLTTPDFNLLYQQQISSNSNPVTQKVGDKLLHGECYGKAYST